MNAFDYCAAAKRMADNLDRIGRGDDAEKLRDSVNFGSTSTEIMMALRFHVKNLLIDESLPKMFIRQAKDLIDYFDSVLR